MARKGLTYEQKKAIPRHLRGAGVRRWWCRYCDTWHGHPVNHCSKHPDYARSQATVKEAKRKASLRNLEKANEGRRKYWEVGSNRRAKAEEMRRWIARWTAEGKYAGENNGFYGKKHTPQVRAAMSMRSARVSRERVRKEVMQELSHIPTQGNRFPPPIGTVDEFSGGERVDHWTGGTDEFDPFR